MSYNSFLPHVYFCYCYKVSAGVWCPHPAFRGNSELYFKENSLMCKLNIQLVKGDHVTIFKLLMYGAFLNWLACRMENPQRLAGRGCMRLLHTHTHPHSIVISVLADLLMLTCSACLLGSWGSILSLSCFFPFVIYSFLSFFFTTFIPFLSFFLVFCCYFISVFQEIWSVIRCELYSPSTFCEPYDLEPLRSSQMYACLCVWLHTDQQELHLLFAKHRGIHCIAGLSAASLSQKPRLFEDRHFSLYWLLEKSSLRFLDWKRDAKDVSVWIQNNLIVIYG